MTETLTASLPPYRDRLRSIMPVEIQRAILADCPEIDRVDAQGRPYVSLNTQCRPKLDPAAAAAAADQVRNAPGIQLDLSRSIMDDQGKINQFQTTQRSAAQLRTALQQR
jgi:hypothetical protein